METGWFLRDPCLSGERLKNSCCSTEAASCKKQHTHRAANALNNSKHPPHCLPVGHGLAEATATPLCSRF